MNITLSSGTRENLSALKSISSKMREVQTRLATGKRVNSASDDASAFFVSTELTNRASGMSGLLSGIANARSTVEAATKALSTVKTLIASAKTLAQQAKDSAVTLASVTGTFGGSLTASSTIATTSGSSTRLRANDVITVSDGTTTATYTAANNDTVQTLMNAVNNTSGLKITASVVNGQLKFTANSNVNITIGATLGGSGTLSGVLGLTAGTTNYVTNTTRQSYATQFDALRTQIDTAIKDASFAGSNLLDGSSITVKFNEAGTSSLELAGSSMSSDSLGLASSSNQFQLDTNIDTALSQIEAATQALSLQANLFGSQEAIMTAREDFMKSMIETLNIGAEQLVATDVNEDSALLLALQMRQQVALTSLSITQGSDTAALRLFGM